MSLVKLLSTLLALAATVSTTSGFVQSGQNFQRPACNRVRFDDFFESFSPSHKYSFANRQYFSEVDRAPVHSLEITSLRSENYGYLVLRSIVNSSFCDIITVWRGIDGVMFAHQGLVVDVSDLRENCIVGFNIDRNSSRRKFYFCLEGVTFEVFQLEDVGLLENSDVFMNSNPKGCNLATLQKVLDRNLEQELRSISAMCISSLILLILVLIQQIIACRIDTCKDN